MIYRKQLKQLCHLLGQARQRDRSHLGEMTKGLKQAKPWHKLFRNNVRLVEYQLILIGLEMKPLLQEAYLKEQELIRGGHTRVPLFGQSYAKELKAVRRELKAAQSKEEGCGKEPGP